MVKQLLVQQLVDSNHTGSDAIYRWFTVDDKGEWGAHLQTGDQAALLSALQSIKLPIILVIPGERVVTTRVTYHAAEKRHFRQLLPYQLEEQIVGDVEDLHFAVGPLQTDSAIVAYVDNRWLAETIAWYEDHGFTVSRCVADFQLLNPAANQWIIWLTKSRIMCCHSSGLGFTVHRDALLQPLLEDLLGEGGADIQVYGSGEREQDFLLQYLPKSAHSKVTQCQGEPSLNPLNPDSVDFCQGTYARKLPLSHWWRTLRTSAVLAVAALLAFIAVNLLEIFQLKDRQRIVKQQIEQRYRQVAPQGVMVDAVKQLQRKLGTTDSETGNSQAIYLLSMAAPAMKAQNVDIGTLTYNDDNKELHLSIEAKAFSAIEKLRKQLQQDGLRAQLKDSSSNDGKVRARLYIRLMDS